MSQFEKNRKQVFGEQLLAVMKRKKGPDGKRLTQQALADAVCVQRETVSRWVRGISCPLDDELIIVFCKTEMQESAERSCRLLQLQNVGSCRRSITTAI